MRVFRSIHLAAAANFDLQDYRPYLYSTFGDNGVESCSPRPLL